MYGRNNMNIICITPAGEIIFPNVSTYIPPRSLCNSTDYEAPIDIPETPLAEKLLPVIGAVFFLIIITTLLYRKCRSLALLT